MRASLDAAAVAVRAGLDGDVLHLTELDITQHRSYQVGWSTTADLSLPIPPVALLQVVDDQLQLCVPDGFLATEPIGERVPADQTVRLRWRSVEILITPSTPTHAHRLKPRRSWPLELLSSTAATVVGLAAMMPALLLLMVSGREAPERHLVFPVRIVYSFHEPVSSTPGTTAPSPKGAAHKPPARNGAAAPSITPREAASRSGVLGLLDSHARFGAVGQGSSSGGSAFDDRSVFDNGRTFNDQSAFDNGRPSRELRGIEIGETHDVGGLGLSGTGEAGSGTGEGTIGLGNIGTIGYGGGSGIGSGYGRGAGGLGGRRAHAPDVVPGSAQVRGALDKEMIRRIIRRHLHEVRYCYEKALQTSPGLSGRVSVKFVIRSDGAVATSQAQDNTLEDPSVADCTAHAFLRWQFFPVPDGGIVLVNYPFDFYPAGL